MRFRKLRIAWSVFWGIACVLLIVLWVRSYSTSDILSHQKNGMLTTFCSSSGRLWCQRRPYDEQSTSSQGWRYTRLDIGGNAESGWFVIRVKPTRKKIQKIQFPY